MLYIYLTYNGGPQAMPCQIISGKKVADQVKDEVKKRVEELQVCGITPGLTVIIVGDDPASQIYVGNKERACQEVGIRSEVVRMTAATTEAQLLEVIDDLNKRTAVHGILVQLPLPRHINEEKVIEAIHPEKDVDGLHPANMGQLLLGRPRFIPCTPYGCLKMIKSTGYKIEGKHAVIVGRSKLIGKPMAALLLRENATVTICHSRTEGLAEYTRSADILVVGVGKPNLITGDMVKPGAFVLDGGINRLSDGKITGDVDFPSVENVAGIATTVPGGLGLTTVAMLLKNTVEAVKYGG